MQGKAVQAYEEYYDSFEGPIGGSERFLWITRTFFEPASRGTMLDIGCGEGSLLELLQLRGYAVHGIDISQGGRQNSLQKHSLRGGAH